MSVGSPLALKHNTKSKIRWRTITKLAQHIDFLHLLCKSPQALWLIRQSVRKQFYTLKQESRPTRLTLLEEQAKELERAGKGKEATIIHNKLKNEQQRERNQRLQRITNDEKIGGIQSVQVDQQATDSEGRGIVDERGSQIITEVDAHCKNQVESACMAEIARRSRMAEYSSSITALLVNYLQYSGTIAAAEKNLAVDIPK
eukprot:12569844-Ditylum_brightwellii.AAC.1